MEHEQPLQTAESVIADRYDVAVVRIEDPQVLPADERVGVQFAEIVPVEINLRGVHRQSTRQGFVAGARAVDDVRRPGLIVITRAVGRAGHLAVAGVKVAAMAQGEAVGLVSAQELRRFSLQQRYERFVTVVRESTVNGLEVHHPRVLPQRQRIDPLQPFRGTVAYKGISADIEFRELPVGRHLSKLERREVHLDDHIRVEIDPGEIRLAEERLRLHRRYLVIVDEQELDGIRNRARVYPR